MTFRPHPAALAAGAAFLWVQPVLAQEAPALLDEIVVDAPLARAPAGADQAQAIEIGPEDLERRDPQTLKQVFSGETAVAVGGGLPAAQKVYVNGIEETNLAVTVDGARQNRKVFHHSTTNLIDPGLLKAVRVDPGVAAADAGPGALAGAISYETVDAADLLAPGRNAGGLATGRIASNGGTFVGGLAAFGRAEGFEGLAYVRYADGDDYKNGDGDEVPYTSASLLSLLAKGAWESATGHRFELSASQVRDDADRPYRANIGSLVDRPDQVVREYDLTSRNVVFSYEAMQARGLWQPSALIAWSEAKADVAVPVDSEGRAEGWSGKIENLFTLSAVNTVSAGVDFYSDRSTYRDSLTSEIGEEADNLGLYAQARLAPVEALSLSFGARGDYQWFEGIDGSKSEHSGLSGNIAADYAVTDAVSINAGYSTVFGGIALLEPYISNPAWIYEDIEPVRAENYSAGVVFDRNGVLLEAALFRTDVDDARDMSFGIGFTPFDFRSQGFRLAAGYAWASGFVRANYTDAEVTSDGSAVDSNTLTYFGVPTGKIVALEAEQRIDRYGLSFGGVIQTSFDNDDLIGLTGFEYQEIEGYTVVDVYAQYQPTQIAGLTVRLEANNLFDETYSDRATYGQEFGEITPNYEPGRSVAISARMTF